MADISSTIEESIVNISKVLSDSSKEQEKMLSYLKNIAKSLDKNVRSEDLNKEIKNYKTTVLKKRVELGDELEKQNRINEELIDNQEAYLISENKRRLSLSKLSDALSDTYRSVSEFQGSFTGLGNILGKLPIIGAILTPIMGLINILDDQLDMFQTVSKSGLQFSDGLTGVNVAVAKIGVGFERGTEILTQYNNLIQRVGIQSFGNFFESVRKTSNNLVRLGFSNDDLVKYSAEYLETQKNLTGLRRFNEVQQSKDFNNVMMEFYKASQMTGVAIGEIIEQLRSMSEDSRTRQVLQSLSQESQQSLALLRARSPEMAERMEQAILRGGIERIDDYGDLIASDLAGVYQSLYNALKAGLSPEQLVNFIAPLGKAADERAKLYATQIRDKEAYLNAELGALANSFVTNTQAAANASEGVGKELLELEQNFRNLINKLQEGISRTIGAFLDPNSPFGEFLNSGLKKLNNWLASNDVIEVVKNFITSIMGLTDTFLSISGGALSWMLKSPLNAVVSGVGFLLAGIAGSAILKNILARGAITLSKLLIRGLGGKGIAAIAAGAAGLYAYDSLKEYFTPDEIQGLQNEPEISGGSSNDSLTPSLGTAPLSNFDVATPSIANNVGLSPPSNTPSQLSTINRPSPRITSNIIDEQNERMKKENEMLRSWSLLFEEQNRLGSVRVLQEKKQLENQNKLVSTINSLG